MLHQAPLKKSNVWGASSKLETWMSSLLEEVLPPSDSSAMPWRQVGSKSSWLLQEIAHQVLLSWRKETLSAVETCSIIWLTPILAQMASPIASMAGKIRRPRRRSLNLSRRKSPLTLKPKGGAQPLRRSQSHLLSQLRRTIKRLTRRTKSLQRFSQISRIL